MSLIHLGLLTKTGRTIFKKLSIFKKEGILAGETGLMLQIGHRYSYDFDVFFQRPLQESDYQKLKTLFEIEEVRLRNEDLFLLRIKEGVEINFVHYYYPPLFRPIKTSSLCLSYFKDIAADKAMTLGRRAVWRDYFDLFYLLYKKYLSLKEIIDLAEKKFRRDFNPALFLEQLIYYEDLHKEKISFYKEKFSEEEVKKFLHQAVKSFREKFLKL